MPRRRRRHLRRLSGALLVLLLLAPVAAVLGALLLVDPNAWRGEIEAAVQQATGRAVRIGRLSLVASASPTLGIADIALANAPGGSRPDMVTVARAEVKLALLPLLAGRIEVARLLLVRPDILLERDPAGRPNWRFGPLRPPGPARPGPPPPLAAPSPAAPSGPAPAILVRSLRIEDGRLTWRGRPPAAPLRLDLRVLEAGADDMAAPVTLSAQGAQAGQALAVMAETGPLAALLDPSAAVPWPVKLTLETPGARLTVTGAVARPLDGEGYALAVEGAAVNLSALDGLLGARLPPLRQVAFAARVVDAGGRLPEVTGIAVRASASDLDAVAPGLKLAHAELSAATLNEPMRAEAEGTLRGAPLRATASFGPLAALLADPPGPTAFPPGAFPVEVAAEAGGATLAVKGSIAAPWRLAGIDLAVTGRIPDLAAMSALAGVRLPALRPVTLDARVADRDTTPGFAIRGLAVTAPEADVSGELVVGLGARPSVQATLSSRRIELDAVLATPPPPPLSPPAIPVPASPAPAPPPPAPPPLPRRPARLIPDGRLPFAALGAVDADLHLAVAELLSGGTAYRNVALRLLLQDGRLALDPVSGTLPGGRLDLRLGVESRAVPPAVALTLRAPGLALRPLLAALRLPDDAAGSVEIDADLHGTGDTPQALAAGLGGRLGLAMTDGELDNRLLGALGTVFTLVQQTGAQPSGEVLGLGRPGRTHLRCLALRADAEAGMVTIGTVLVDTGRILVHGAGTLNLRDEALQLRLRPMLRGATPVVVPVRVGGTLLDPKVTPDAAGTLAGLAAGLTGARALPFATMAAVIAGERNGDACGPALAAARGGPRPAAAAPAPRLPNPADLLHNLLPR